MWFKNLTFFTLKNASSIDFKSMEKAMPDFALKECGSQDGFTTGWLKLVRNSEMWTLVNGDCMLFRAGKEEKVLPAAVVREELEAKVAALELQEGRKVGRKEKADMKDELTYTLRSKAFAKRSDVWAYIDKNQGYLVVNSTSLGVHEWLFKLIQATLGEFPMTPVSPQVAPYSVLTDWLASNSLPASLTTGDKVVIQDSSEDKASIAFKALEPLSEDVTRHLSQGMSVKSLSLDWAEKASFTIDDALLIRGVRFADSLREAAFQDSEGGPFAEMDADFAIMLGTIRELYEALGNWFELAPAD